MASLSANETKVDSTSNADDENDVIMEEKTSHQDKNPGEHLDIALEHIVAKGLDTSDNDQNQDETIVVFQSKCESQVLSDVISETNSDNEASSQAKDSPVFLSVNSLTSLDSLCSEVQEKDGRVSPEQIESGTDLAHALANPKELVCDGGDNQHTQQFETDQVLHIEDSQTGFMVDNAQVVTHKTSDFSKEKEPESCNNTVGLYIDGQNVQDSGIHIAENEDNLDGTKESNLGADSSEMKDDVGIEITGCEEEMIEVAKESVTEKVSCSDATSENLISTSCLGKNNNENDESLTENQSQTICFLSEDCMGISSLTEGALEPVVTTVHSENVRTPSILEVDQSTKMWNNIKRCRSNGMLIAVSLHDMSAKDFARFLPELHMLAENLEIYKRPFKRHNRKTSIKWTAFLGLDHFHQMTTLLNKMGKTNLTKLKQNVSFKYIGHHPPLEVSYCLCFSNKKILNTEQLSVKALSKFKGNTFFELAYQNMPEGVPSELFQYLFPGFVWCRYDFEKLTKSNRQTNAVSRKGCKLIFYFMSAEEADLFESFYSKIKINNQSLSLEYKGCYRQFTKFTEKNPSQDKKLKIPRGLQLVGNNLKQKTNGKKQTVIYSPITILELTKNHLSMEDSSDSGEHKSHQPASSSKSSTKTKKSVDKSQPHKPRVPKNEQPKLASEKQSKNGSDLPNPGSCDRSQPEDKPTDEKSSTNTAVNNNDTGTSQVGPCNTLTGQQELSSTHPGATQSQLNAYTIGPSPGAESTQFFTPLNTPTPTNQMPMCSPGMYFRPMQIPINMSRFMPSSGTMQVPYQSSVTRFPPPGYPQYTFPQRMNIQYQNYQVPPPPPQQTQTDDAKWEEEVANFTNKLQKNRPIRRSRSRSPNRVHNKRFSGDHRSGSRDASPRRSWSRSPVRYGRYGNFSSRVPRHGRITSPLRYVPCRDRSKSPRRLRRSPVRDRSPPYSHRRVSRSPHSPLKKRRTSDRDTSPAKKRKASDSKKEKSVEKKAGDSSGNAAKTVVKQEKKVTDPSETADREVMKDGVKCKKKKHTEEAKKVSIIVKDDLVEGDTKERSMRDKNRPSQKSPEKEIFKDRFLMSKDSIHRSHKIEDTIPNDGDERSLYRESYKNYMQQPSPDRHMKNRSPSPKYVFHPISSASSSATKSHREYSPALSPVSRERVMLEELSREKQKLEELTRKRVMLKDVQDPRLHLYHSDGKQVPMDSMKGNESPVQNREKKQLREPTYLSKKKCVEYDSDDSYGGSEQLKKKSTLKGWGARNRHSRSRSSSPSLQEEDRSFQQKVKDAIARKTETPSDAAVDYIFEILSEIASSDREEFPHLTRATAHTIKNNPTRELSPTFQRSSLEKGYTRESPRSSIPRFSEQKRLQEESSDAVSSSTAKFEMENEYEPRNSVSDPYEGRFVWSQQNVVSNIIDKQVSNPSSETLSRSKPAASKRTEAPMRATDDEILSMIHQLQKEVKPVKLSATSTHAPSPYMSAAEPNRYDKKEASSYMKNAKIEHSANFGQNKSSFSKDSLKTTNKQTVPYSSTSKSSSKKVETPSRASDDDILSMIRKLQKEVKPTKISTQSSQSSSSSYIPSEELSRYSRHDSSTYKGNSRAEQHLSQDYNESAYTTNILKEPFKHTSAKGHTATARSEAEVADLAALLLEAVQMTVGNKGSEDNSKTSLKHGKSGFAHPPYDDRY
ncbi:serine/arginine repetitive matrix protein 2-like [Physella acuta]|uniref:serine/arginine repetitive matrix protein 2-like n=1 Tax=Physella acuta TaxID=109671 RepID=UPI0027DC1FE7|nr:serine/arginine repetitive matrix protein 2-like [Physella acuta]